MDKINRNAEYKPKTDEQIFDENDFVGTIETGPFTGFNMFHFGAGNFGVMIFGHGVNLKTEMFDQVINWHELYRLNGKFKPLNGIADSR